MFSGLHNEHLNLCGFVLWSTYTVMTYVQTICISEVCFLSFVNVMVFHSSESILQITCISWVPSFFLFCVVLHKTLVLLLVHETSVIMQCMSSSWTVKNRKIPTWINQPGSCTYVLSLNWCVHQGNFLYVNALSCDEGVHIIYMLFCQ